MAAMHSSTALLLLLEHALRNLFLAVRHQLLHQAKTLLVVRDRAVPVQTVQQRRQHLLRQRLQTLIQAIHLAVVHRRVVGVVLGDLLLARLVGRQGRPGEGDIPPVVVGLG